MCGADFFLSIAAAVRVQAVVSDDIPCEAIHVSVTPPAVNDCLNYAGLDTQTHKYRCNYRLYSISDRGCCSAAAVYENKQPFLEQLREDTLVTLVTSGNLFFSFFLFSHL